jgi:CheY-like chemotaxis protein
MPDTILLAEDSPEDVLFMRRALERIGSEISLEVVEDGQQAIDYLTGVGAFSDRVSHPLPDLVLLDLKLPLISGHEVLQWIRSEPNLKSTIVVVLTSSDHPSDIKLAYALGANSFLSKPSNPAHLTELLRSVTDYWLRRNVADHT